MVIEKARELGFCFGVRRALRIIEEAVNDTRKIVTLGPIVHNKTVVAKLMKLGIHVIERIEDSEGGIVAVSSHGVSPEVLSQMKALGCRYIDTTCPIVRSAQKAAQKLSEQGFGVIIFGEADHPEVRGLLGWAGAGAIAAMNPDAIQMEKLPRRIGIIAQTTQSHSEFTFFVNRLIENQILYSHEIRIINTLCQETQKRQHAALELAGKSDLMIVIGGHNSANTCRLAEVCRPIVETHHIENSDEVDTGWFEGKKAVGITAGASTPDEAIELVIEKIQKKAES